MNIICADVLDGLAQLADESIHCVVTSPPYLGLRDYGTATWEGGDPTCDHKQGRSGSGRADGIVDERGQRNRDGVGSMGGDCRKCGARRVDRQIGLERTPRAYVERLVAVFREVRRVLRDDGTLWPNLGDSYASGKGTCHNPGGGPLSYIQDKERFQLDRGSAASLQESGLKPKDLVGIPWRVAFALQADGWWLRQDIIFAKTNPLPESVTDRCTKSHEYLFLLTKRARYYYDAKAIAEPDKGWNGKSGAKNYRPGAERGRISGSMNSGGPSGLRNRRSVWTIATQPYHGAHFATFPEKLVEPCILAGCPMGGTVLDPFLGSGTTLAVAKRLGRDGVGIELNPAYVELAKRRIADTQAPPATRETIMEGE